MIFCESFLELEKNAKKRCFGWLFVGREAVSVANVCRFFFFFCLLFLW